MEKIRKKIIKFGTNLTKFFKQNLAQLVLLLILGQILFVVKDLPFINLINNFEYYSLSVLLFLAMLLFRVAIPNRMVIYLIMMLFIASYISVVVDVADISTILGFIIFTLLFFVVAREVVRERKELKKEINE